MPPQEQGHHAVMWPAEPPLSSGDTLLPAMSLLHNMRLPSVTSIPDATRASINLSNLTCLLEYADGSRWKPKSSETWRKGSIPRTYSAFAQIQFFAEDIPNALTSTHFKSSVMQQSTEKRLLFKAHPSHQRTLLLYPRINVESASPKLDIAHHTATKINSNERSYNLEKRRAIVYDGRDAELLSKAQLMPQMNIKAQIQC